MSTSEKVRLAEASAVDSAIPALPESFSDIIPKRLRGWPWLRLRVFF